jgi:hypothetical protein
MRNTGLLLGQQLAGILPQNSRCGVITTVEDADYFSSGIIDSLKCDHIVSTRIIFNKHFKDFGIAPIMSSFSKLDFCKSTILILSISTLLDTPIARTNILNSVDKTGCNKIFIVTSLVEGKIFNKLIKELPESLEISLLFKTVKINEHLLNGDDVSDVINFFGGYQ